MHEQITILSTQKTQERGVRRIHCGMRDPKILLADSPRASLDYDKDRRTDRWEKFSFSVGTDLRA